MEAGISATIAGGPPLAVPSEAESFAELYERCFTRVYGYVASLLRDRSAAEDVTAQAFERAYRKRSSYRAGRGSAEAWLFGIARNAALDELRRRKRHAQLDHEPEDRTLPGPDEQAETRAQARRRPGRARHPRRPRPRPRGPQVRRWPLERRDRARTRHHRVQRGHPSAPNRHEAEEGLR